MMSHVGIHLLSEITKLHMHTLRHTPKKMVEKFKSQVGTHACLASTVLRHGITVKNQERILHRTRQYLRIKERFLGKSDCINDSFLKYT